MSDSNSVECPECNGFGGRAVLVSYGEQEESVFDECELCYATGAITKELYSEWVLSNGESVGD